MSIFRRLFGSKPNETNKEERAMERAERKDAPWMTDRRRANLKLATEAGFKPASSLPTGLDGQLRPSEEIALRLSAIKAMVLWLVVPEDRLPDEVIEKYVEINQLQEFMTSEERQIFQSSRTDEQALNSIGWKFENAWPLAWYFGYESPAIDGAMMSGDRMQHILRDFSCPLDGRVLEWVQDQEVRDSEAVLGLEDLFYCLHNAVRSAQLGGDTVPEGFDPRANGGVIHERRHALTWMVSEGVKWADTDLST